VRGTFFDPFKKHTNSKTMVHTTFRGAALAIQANIKIKNKFANKVEDPQNPYSNHSETESEEDDELPVSSPGLHDKEGRPSVAKSPSALRRYKGMLFALMSSFIFSVGALLVKKLPGYHPFSIALWRFQGAFLPMVPIIAHKLFISGQEHKITNGIWPLNKLKNAGLVTLVLV
jgi:hypothetical protein